MSCVAAPASPRVAFVVFLRPDWADSSSAPAGGAPAGPWRARPRRLARWGPARAASVSPWPAGEFTIFADLKPSSPGWSPAATFEADCCMEAAERSLNASARPGAQHSRGYDYTCTAETSNRAPPRLGSGARGPSRHKVLRASRLAVLVPLCAYAQFAVDMFAASFLTAANQQARKVPLESAQQALSNALSNAENGRLVAALRATRRVSAIKALTTSCWAASPRSRYAART